MRGLINGGLTIRRTMNYSLMSSSGSKFTSTITATGGSSIMFLFMNSTDNSLTHSCDGYAYNRKCSLASLGLANIRNSLIGRVCTAKGPIILVLMAKHPFSVA